MDATQGRRRRVSPREKEALAADLRWRFVRDCQAGGLRPGDLLPSVNELTARYGASLAIARDLYRQLEAEGAVEAFQGKGVLLRGRLEADARPRALRLGIVAHLEFTDPTHVHNRACAVLNAFERRSSELGGSCRLFNLHPGHDVTLPALEAVKAARPDGLLFIPPYEENAEDNLRKLLMLGIPLVVTECQTTLAHRVLHDHRQAAATATAHLRGLGLEKLAFLQLRGPRFWARERRQGFLDAGGGLVLDVDHQSWEPGFRPELDALFPKLRQEGVQGVLCSGDHFAVALLEKARRAGVRVPDELAIVGVDDSWRFRSFNLTTIQISDPELGNAAYDLLAEVVAKRQPNFVERRIPCPLLVRETAPAKLNTPCLTGGGR